MHDLGYLYNIAAATLGLARGPDEDDEHLRVRLLATLTYHHHTQNRTHLSLCLLLARLNVKAARRDLPIGVA